MTRPIFEPTLPRVDAELGYGRDQLFRRPAPQGGSLIPGFHAHKESTLVLTNGNDGRLNWDEWIIDDDTVFQAGVLTGSDLTEIKLMLPGWYAVHCWATWSADPASGFGGISMLHDDTDIAEARQAMGLTYPVNFATAPTMTFQIVRYFPPDFTSAKPLNFAFVDRLEFWVVQNSGVNRTINEAYCNIAFLGPRNSTTPSS